MQSKALLCPVCFSGYDQAEHTPRNLPKCDHTICSKCLTAILAKKEELKCPLDDSSFYPNQTATKDFSINSLAIQLLQEKSQKDRCSHHQENVKLLCLSDRTKMCVDCILSDSHQGHDVKSLRQIQNDITSKKENLEQWLKTTEMNEKTIDDQLEETRKSLIDLVQTQCRKLELVIANKGIELMKEINSFFEEETEKLDQHLKSSRKLKQDLAQKISKINNLLSRNGYFEIFDELNLPNPSEINLKPAHTQLDLIRTKSRKVAQNFNHSFDHCKTYFEQLNIHLNINPQNMSPSPSRIDIHSQILQESNSLVYNEKLARVEDLLQNPEKMTINFEKLEKLKTAKIAIDQYLFTNEYMKSLLFLYQDIKDLDSLEILFSPQDISDGAFVKIFSILFLDNNELKTIKINLNNCKVGDRSIAFLAQNVLSLSKFSKLQSLDLNLTNTEITDQSIKEITDFCSPLLSTLESFKLSLGGTKITDESINKIYTNMSKCKVFAFNLSETKVSDKSIKIFAQSCLSTMKNLESLSFNLSATRVTDQSFTEILSALENIKEFIMDLGSTKITDKSLDMLGRIMPTSMKNLTNFELHLDSTHTTNRGLKQIFIPLPHVKRYILYLDSTEVTNKGLEIFTKVTLPSFLELEIFEMYLSDTKVNDQSLKELFSNFKHLREFTLDLSETKVSDETLQSLANLGLMNMNCLESFELVLYDTEITDDGLAHICIPSKHLRRYVLHLDSTGITDYGLEILSQKALRLNESLKVLELHFFDTRITDDSVMKLFSTLSNIEKLIIDFDSTEVTDKVGLAFINLVQKSQHLKHFDVDFSNTLVSPKIVDKISSLKKPLQ